jgi:response regulator RpfG family c-di-GMP phosphodiesterase
LGFTEKESALIHLAASMHDIGKIAIDDRILNKPAKLTAEEFEHVKNHCLYGYQLLKNSNRALLRTAAVIAYEHHENYDGSGYPRRLEGEGIHYTAAS